MQTGGPRGRCIGPTNSRQSLFDVARCALKFTIKVHPLIFLRVPAVRRGNIATDASGRVHCVHIGILRINLSRFLLSSPQRWWTMRVRGPSHCAADATGGYGLFSFISERFTLVPMLKSTRRTLGVAFKKGWADVAVGDDPMVTTLSDCTMQKAISSETEERKVLTSCAEEATALVQSEEAR